MKPAALTESELKKYKEWGLHLVPLSDGSKAPRYKKFWDKDKDGKWIPDCCWKKNPETKEFIRWSDEELLQAERVGINHEACSLIDVDCDDIDASQFMSEFPETFTVGSKVNGSTFIRKKLYFYNGVTEHKSFGKGLDCGAIIENLSHTQSWSFGDGRIILNDVKPTILSDEQYKRLKESVREVYALTMLTKLYPKKDTNRDEFNMALTGTLHRETNWTSDHIKEFQTKLCNAVGDSAVRKRLEKVDRFKNNLDDPDKRVWGVKKLTELCGADAKAGLDFIDAIKPKENLPKADLTPLVTLGLSKFVERNYPPIIYYLHPLSSTEQLVQWYGLPGEGKTLFCLNKGWCESQGLDFMHFKFNPNIKKPPPVLYVEGEMSATQLQERVCTIIDRDKNKKIYDIDNFEIAVMKEQPNENFTKLIHEDGRKKVELSAEELFKRTGIKPIIYIDNIRMLMGMFDEKDSTPWIPFVGWLAQMRARGYSVNFLHHSTNEGSKASGSGLKESNLNLNVQLSKPKDDEFLDLDDDYYTQIKFEAKKWREVHIGWQKPFIISVNKESMEFKNHPLLTKKQRRVKELHDSGLSGKDIVSKLNKEISKAQIYRILKMFKQEVKNEII